MAGGERIKAWEVGDAETGEHRAEVFLIRAEPRGELDLYRGTTLIGTRPIGIVEIALFASGRKDLLSVYMSAVVEVVEHPDDTSEAKFRALLDTFTRPDDTTTRH